MLELLGREHSYNLGKPILFEIIQQYLRFRTYLDFTDIASQGFQSVFSKDTPKLFLARHQSNKDIEVLYKILYPNRANLYWVAKSTLPKFISCFNNIIPLVRPQDLRTNTESRTELATRYLEDKLVQFHVNKVLRGNKSIVFFPEGTRNPGDEVGHIHPATISLIRDFLKGIEDVTEIYFVGSFYDFEKKKVSMSFSEPFSYETIFSGKRKEILNRMRDNLSLLGEQSQYLFNPLTSHKSV